MVIGRRESRRPDSRAEWRGSIESLSIEDKLDKVAQIGRVETIQGRPFGDVGFDRRGFVWRSRPGFSSLVRSALAGPLDRCIEIRHVFAKPNREFSSLLVRH